MKSTAFTGTLLERPRRAIAEPEPEQKDDSLPTALSAECTCPDYCERDHDTD